MKKIFILGIIGLLVSCNKTSRTEATKDDSEVKTETTENGQTMVDGNVKDKSFEELFTAIEPAQIQESVFKFLHLSQLHPEK